MNYPKQRYRGPHPWTNKEWLYEEYIIKNRAVEDIAGDYGCSPATIEKAANVQGLKRPPLPKKKKTPPKPYEDKETLRRLYFDEGKNLTEIGKILGCSSDTIRVKMKGFGLPIKEFSFGKLDGVDLKELYINQSNKSAWPPLAALGLILTLIIVSTVNLIRYLCNKYGPSEV